MKFYKPDILQLILIGEEIEPVTQDANVVEGETQKYKE